MKIDKDIPLPPANLGNRLKHHELYEIVKQMKIGESFLAEKIHICGQVFSPKQSLERKHGIKLCQRKTPEGIRVWRIA